MSEGAKGAMKKAVLGAAGAVAVGKGLKAARRHDAPAPEGDGQRVGEHDRERPPAEPPAQARKPDDGHGSAQEAKSTPKRWLRRLNAVQQEKPWLGFPLATVKKFGEDQAGDLAALISYYTFFSIFPLLLALVTILGFVLGDNIELQRRVLDSALAQFPVIGNQIRENIGSLDGNWVALIVGVGAALWAGLGAVDAAQNAMNSVWDVPIKEKPKFLARKLRSLLTLVVVGGGLLLTAGASTVASTAESLGPVGRLLYPVLSVVVNTAVFMVAFRVLTERNLRWSDVLPGAVVAGVAATVLQMVGGVIIEHRLKGASQTYGTFAVVIGLLSWIYLQAQITLLAAEVNVVRSGRLWPRSLIQEEIDLTEADRRALARHAEVEERVDDQDVRTALPGEQRERGVDRPTPAR